MSKALMVPILWLALVGCGGGNGEGGGQEVSDPPVVDATGRFLSQNSVCVDPQGGSVVLREVPFSVTQEGQEVRVVNELDGTVSTGVIRGDVLTVHTEVTLDGVTCVEEDICTFLTRDDAACVADVVCTDGTLLVCTAQFVRI